MRPQQTASARAEPWERIGPTRRRPGPIVSTTWLRDLSRACARISTNCHENTWTAFWRVDGQSPKDVAAELSMQPGTCAWQGRACFSGCGGMGWESRWSRVSQPHRDLLCQESSY